MYSTELKLPPPILLENIPDLWKKNEILILLINLNSYNILSTEHLDKTEKEHLETLKTNYFKKRYLVSRMVLKNVVMYIQGDILKGQSLSDIGTYNDKYGKVHIRNHRELNICISYTENIASLAISKVEVGIDIELKKVICPGKISKCLCIKASEAEDFGNEPDLLRIWTLKEAYCKFSNKTLLSTLIRELDLSDVFHSSFILNDKYILSVISDANSHLLNINCLSKIETYEHTNIL